MGGESVAGPLRESEDLRKHGVASEGVDLAYQVTVVSEQTSLLGRGCARVDVRTCPVANEAAGLQKSSTAPTCMSIYFTRVVILHGRRTKGRPSSRSQSADRSKLPKYHSARCDDPASLLCQRGQSRARRAGDPNDFGRVAGEQLASRHHCVADVLRSPFRPGCRRTARCRRATDGSAKGGPAPLWDANPFRHPNSPARVWRLVDGVSTQRRTLIRTRPSRHLSARL